VATRWRARVGHATVWCEQQAETRTTFRLPLTFITWYVGRQGMILASAVAFRMFLWLMPLSLLFAGILAGVAGTDTATAKSMTESAGITGTATDQVVAVVRDGERSWWIAVLLGGAGALWGAKSLLRSLWLVHAHAWQIVAPKPPVRQVVVTVFVFVGAWVGLLATTAAIPRLDDVMPGGVFVAVAAEIAAATAIWLAVTIRLPHLRSTWHDLLPGAALVGVCLTVLHAVSRIYIPRQLAHSSQLYGTLGVAAVILTWLLMLGLIIVGAAIANAVWHDHRQQANR
jgi:uncharacterized BrkB/YihY/UPF0761 family membrane protein